MTTPTISDFWHCRNQSSLHTNSTFLFPNEVLPVLDTFFSLLGALINLLFMLTIYVRGKRLGTTPLSSIFYAFICLANLVECVNSIVIARSKHIASSEINYYLYIASGIEDIIHFVRIGLFLPVYVIRLLYVLMPERFNAYNTNVLTWDKAYCFILCIVGCFVGGFRMYARMKIARINQRSMSDGDAGGDVHVMEMISFVLILINMVFHCISMLIFFATILCLLKFYFEVRSVETRSEPEDGNPQGFTIINRSNVILNVIKPALQLLTLLFVTELFFQSYLLVISFTTLKIYFTPGCYPEVFVKIRNYLGSPANFVYSYHCLGVLHGITICVIFFLQNTMKQTVRFMWRVGGLLASFSLEKLRARSRGESQRVPSFYSVIGHEDTI